MPLKVWIFAYLLCSFIIGKAGGNSDINGNNVPVSKQGSSAKQTYPNIVLFLADDMGYGDLGCYGNDKVKTPNIDRLARDGILFTRMYSQPVCTPARAALLTGRQPARMGMMSDPSSFFLQWPVFRSHGQPGGIPASEVTLPEELKRHGYRTAILGKWHLGSGQNGEYLPKSKGFDYFYGTPGTHSAACAGNEEYVVNDYDVFLKSLKQVRASIFSCLLFLLALYAFRIVDNKFVYVTLSLLVLYIVTLRGFLFLSFDNPMSCTLVENSKVIEQPYKDENMTLRMTHKALRFLQNSTDPQKPVFMFMSYLTPHVPSFRSRRFINRSGIGPYFDSVEEIDWSIGIIVQALKTQGLYRNTLLIFASDNGPELTNPSTGMMNIAEMQGSKVLTRALDDSVQQRITLRGEKGSVLEGGIRIPAVFWWPGVIPSGHQFHGVASLMDVFPTIRDICNITPTSNRKLDGKSLHNVFKTLKNQPQSGNTVHEVDSHHNVLLHYCSIDYVAAVSYKDLKVHYIGSTNDRKCSGISYDPPVIYNITEDPGERFPLPFIDNKNVIDEINIILRDHESSMLLPGSKRWSQYSQLPRPWNFQCENFPFCHKSTPDEDYEYLFDISQP